MSLTALGPEAQGLHLDVFVKGDLVCLWFVQPHPSSGLGLRREQRLDPDSVSRAQPAERAQLGKGGFPRLLWKERW